MEWDTAAMALLDSGAMHCFVWATLVASFELKMKPRGSMDVMLADGSQVSASHTCLFLWLCVLNVAKLCTVWLSAVYSLS